MKHRYLQRFVYSKALHEFSVNIRALEQDHHQYIVYLYDYLIFVNVLNKQ